MPTRVVLTYRDYEALPADGRRYELHDGELLVTAAPGLPHQRVVGELFALLRQHVRAHRLGEVFVSPVDCILSDTTVVQPDLVFLESARSSTASPRGIEGPTTWTRKPGASKPLCLPEALTGSRRVLPMRIAAHYRRSKG